MKPVSPRFKQLLALSAVWLIAITSVTGETNAVSGTVCKSEVLRLPVLKVYATNEGPASFRAYVVKWNEAEVVVSDNLGTTNFKEGDIVEVLVMRLSGETRHQLVFQVMPQVRARKVLAFNPAAGPMPVSNPKTPSYLDCRADCVVVYPGKTRVTWDELQRPGNLVEQMLDKIQVRNEAEFVLVMVRPQSVKFYRVVRGLISKRPAVDSSYDAIDADFEVNWDESKKALVIAEGAPEVPKAAPRGVSSNKPPVFFECRGNEVFIVGMEALAAQTTKVLSGVDPSSRGDVSQFLEAGRTVSNEYYTANLSYLMTGMLALEPRPGVPGELPNSSKLQAAFEQAALNKQSISFLVKDDGFQVFRAVRALAEKRGLQTGWELLGVDEPIKFASGGKGIGR
jgi:hypothetical protein